MRVAPGISQIQCPYCSTKLTIAKPAEPTSRPAAAPPASAAPRPPQPSAPRPATSSAAARPAISSRPQPPPGAFRPKQPPPPVAPPPLAGPGGIDPAAVWPPPDPTPPPPPPQFAPQRGVEPQPWVAAVAPINEMDLPPPKLGRSVYELQKIKGKQVMAYRIGGLVVVGVLILAGALVLRYRSVHVGRPVVKAPADDDSSANAPSTPRGRRPAANPSGPGTTVAVLPSRTRPGNPASGPAGESTNPATAGKARLRFDSNNLTLTADKNDSTSRTLVGLLDSLETSAIRVASVRMTLRNKSGTPWEPSDPDGKPLNLTFWLYTIPAEARQLRFACPFKNLEPPADVDLRRTTFEVLNASALAEDNGLVEIPRESVQYDITKGEVSCKVTNPAAGSMLGVTVRIQILDPSGRVLLAEVDGPVDGGAMMESKETKKFTAKIDPALQPGAGEFQFEARGSGQVLAPSAPSGGGSN